MRLPALTFLLLFCLSLSAQSRWSAALENGVAITSTNTDLIVGTRLSYAVPISGLWSLRFSLGGERITVTTGLVETNEDAPFPELTPYRKIKSPENRVMAGVAIYRQAGRFQIGAGLRANYRLTNEFELYVMTEPPGQETFRREAAFDDWFAPQPGIFNAFIVRVDTKRTRLQAEAMVDYALTEHISLGLTYRYDAFSGNYYQVAEQGGATGSLNNYANVDARALYLQAGVEVQF